MNTILFPVFTRGNYSKLHLIIEDLKKTKKIRPIVLLGGLMVEEKYGKILDYEGTNEFEYDVKLNFVVAGENLESMAKTASVAFGDFVSTLIFLFDI